MKLRRLRDPFHYGDLREDLQQQAGFIQQFESPARPALGEDADQLVPNALGGNAVNQARHLLDGLERSRFNLEFEPRGEANGPEQPQVVFLESRGRIADGPDEAVPQVLFPADVVEYLAGLGVLEQRIDREITPHGVLAGI
jgi:hypothetical protein